MQYYAILFAALIAVTQSAHDDNHLQEEYSYHKSLDPSGRYMLYWSFNLSTEVVRFAVDVETEGWIGFGLSPNGKMPGSDVVMGWVDDRTGGAHFSVRFCMHRRFVTKNLFFFLQDRYAAVRGLPSVDAEQNWFLTHAKQENGHTILKFYRNFTSCDDHDLDITVSFTKL